MCTNFLESQDFVQFGSTQIPGQSIKIHQRLMDICLKSEYKIIEKYFVVCFVIKILGDQWRHVTCGELSYKINKTLLVVYMTIT